MCAFCIILKCTYKQLESTHIAVQFFLLLLDIRIGQYKMPRRAKRWFREIFQLVTLQRFDSNSYSSLW